jgi:glutamate dehydrogenase (NADP+)
MEAIYKTLKQIKQRDPNEWEFHQAAEEVLVLLQPILEREPKYKTILLLIVEPERIIMFRMLWVDDNDIVQANRGYRVRLVLIKVNFDFVQMW